MVFTSPDASPASAWVAPDMASVISAGKQTADPEAEQQHHRQDVDDVVAVDGRQGEQGEPDRDQREPREQRRAAAPKRMISGSE